MTNRNSVSGFARGVFKMGIFAAVLLVAAASGCRSAAVAVVETTSVALYEPCTLHLTLEKQPANPFDPAEISVAAVFTHESGAMLVIHGFWYQEFSCTRDGKTGAEQLAPVGEPGFRIKFAPRGLGRWTWHWRIVRKGRVEEQPGGEVIVGKALGRGFVVRSPSPRYLMTSLGEPLFLIGQNVAWGSPATPLEDFTRYINELAGSGQNCMRIWQCTWGLGIEHDQIGQYDLKRAWVLDQIIEQARKRGVYIFFVLENAHDVHDRKSPYWQKMRYREDFFTSEPLRTAFRNRMRYAAARWGYSTSILAWEFFNEMEYALLDPLEGNASVREQYFAPWLNEMAAAMRLYDGHGHLLTNSLATDRIWDAMFEHPWLDIVQHHTYMSSSESDTAGKVVATLEELRRYGKPYLLGEFGGAPDNLDGGDESIVNKQDPDGIHLHDSLWASAMSGAAGTPMNWWWDSYIRPNGLNRHYAALSRFLEGTPWVDPSLRASYVPVGNARVMMLRGNGWVRLWAQNSNFTWQSAATADGAAPVAAFPLRLGNMPEGNYRIEWWDTNTGKATDSQTVRCDGVLPLKFPEFKHDIAARVWREAEAGPN